MNYIIAFIIIFIWVFLFLNYRHSLKIKTLEKKVIKQIKSKNNLISCLFEISKNDLVKHERIFSNLVILKNKYNKQILKKACILEKTITNKQIDRELSFIFNISDNNKSIRKNKNYIYLKNYLNKKINNINNLTIEYFILTDKKYFIKNIISSTIQFKLKKEIA